MASSSCSTTTCECDQSRCCKNTTIIIVHPDIIEKHVLARLDGQTLAAVSCTSSQLHLLCSQEKLWQEICSSTWPSTSDPRVKSIISTFPAGHRSYFSDSFPALDCLQKQPSKQYSALSRDKLTKELISSIDIYYKNNPICSKVAGIETVTGWFQFHPFRIDLLDPKDGVQMPIPFLDETDDLLKRLEGNLTLSWVMIDSSRKRAANLSSRWPVSVEQDWLTHDLHVKFAAVIVGDQRWGLFSTMGVVECEVMVILGGKEGGEMNVKEVIMQMKDMEGRNLTGRDSLLILQWAMENGKRRIWKKEEGKGRYQEFLEMKRERKKRNERVESVLSNVCLAALFVVFVFFFSRQFI